MTTTDLAGLIVSLGDVLLVIVIIVGNCYSYYRQRRRDDNNNRRQEAAAAEEPHAQAQPAAPAVQMAAMAVVDLLDHVTYPRQNAAAVVSSPSSSSSAPGGGVGGGGDNPAAEECAICLGQFEDGDSCSVMPGCRHEFHRSCIARWLTACNNTCPLCRAQLQWAAIAHDDMV